MDDDVCGLCVLMSWVFGDVVILSLLQYFFFLFPMCLLII